MTHWEYKVVPAPAKGTKAKGVKGPAGRFANSIETVMNDMAAEGWEYQRAETLPSEERSGLTSSATVFRNILVFRRAKENDLGTFQPKTLEPAEPQAHAGDKQSEDIDHDQGLDENPRREPALTAEMPSDPVEDTPSDTTETPEKT